MASGPEQNPEWEHLWEIFHQALAQTDSERSSFLERACGENRKLQHEVNELLVAHEQTTGLLERSLSGPFDGGSPIEPTVGDLIDCYRILRAIGIGGMGIVYEAEQEQPLRRRVALKLIRLGMDTREVISRFEAERQALALMDHPGIARVFDAGTTDRGRPYFVMEYVAGTPITLFCDEHRLTTDERLSLFLDLCEAVQHAHRRGILHRDLKPSNLLVVGDEGKPTPKIIDFGVAKAVEQRLTDKTLHTRLGMIVGTPEYMSPEQAELGARDIDTRTDVYSLGVVLYELLAGAHPLDTASFRQVSFDEIRRRIREEEPARLSTRTGSFDETTTASIAAARQTEPASLRRRLRGDLDWITHKCLEKDRDRRYGSVAELSADIRRHLHHQPVQAGPPSVRYRAGKFMRRHPLGVSVASLSILFLTVVAMVTGLQAKRIALERDRAQLEAATSEQVSDFLVELFEVSNPGRSLGETITARELLDRGRERISGELSDQPEVRARLLSTLGDVHTNLGLHDDAEPLLEEVVAIRRNLVGESHPSYAEALRRLGKLHLAQGDLDAAHSELAQVLEILDSSEPRQSRSLALATKELADVLSRLGEFDDAIELYEQARVLLETDVGDEEPQLIDLLLALGYTYRDANQLDAARASVDRGLEIAQRILPEGHPQIGSLLNNLAIIYWTEGDYVNCKLNLERSLAIFEKVYEGDHPNVAALRNNLGRIIYDMGDPAAARPYFEEALAMRERMLPPDHPDLASTILNLALMHAALGDHQTALPLYERGIAIWEAKLAPEHRFLAEPLAGYAASLHALGRSSEASPLFERAIAIRSKRLGADDPRLIEILEPYEAYLRDVQEVKKAEEIAARIEAIEAQDS